MIMAERFWNIAKQLSLWSYRITESGATFSNNLPPDEDSYRTFELRAVEKKNLNYFTVPVYSKAR